MDAMNVPSADVLHLIQAHLTESGLHATSSTLRSESGGVGLPGLFPASKATLLQSARDGRWGEVLELLSALDLERVRRSYVEDYSRANREGGEGGADNHNNEQQQRSSSIVTPLERAVALAHEMAILELAEQNEVDLAYATLRMCSEMLDRVLSLDDLGDEEYGGGGGSTTSNIGLISSRSGDVERRITALSSMRRSSAGDATLVPSNYYGPTNPTKQKRRDQCAKLLKRHIPEIPLKRLPTLLQQSVKWQCHTGTFPTVQRLFQEADDDCEDKVEEEGDGSKKKKKRSKKNLEQKFDLVLGNVDVSGDNTKRKRKKEVGGGTAGSSAVERIPSRIYQTIRLGKKSYIESACFLPDGRGLVTGSSDGFVEVWGEPISLNKGDAAASDNTILPTTEIDFEKLRTSDLAYQRNDDLMMHDTPILAMNVSHDGTLLGTTSSDGTVSIWKLSEGKLLRKIERAHGGSGGVSDKGAAVTCIQFSHDGSRVLTGGHDSTCREFGLLASRMLKEFRGHRSYVNCCDYVVLPHAVMGDNAGGSEGHKGDGGFLAVVTASADGSVRIWSGRTAEPIREINPPIPTSANAVIHDKDSIVGSKSIHTVMHLHSPAHTMIIVPRCDRAFLVSFSGAVLRTFTRDDVQGTDFLAATVSPSNQWLFVAADDGKCVVFNIETGKVEKIIRSFAEDCSSGRSGKACDISNLVFHPHRGVLGAYSNDKEQKRGVLTLWK